MFDALAEAGIGLHLDALQHIVQPGGGKLRHSYLAAMDLGDRGQFGQLLAQLAGQRGIDTPAHGHEAAAAGGGGQHLFQFEHQPLVELCPALQPKPVALALQLQVERPGADADHPHLLTARPIDRQHCRELRQRLDHAQTEIGFVHQPLADDIAARGRREKFERAEHGIEVGTLGIEDRFALHRRHHPRPSNAGHQARAIGPQRRHHQTQHEALAHG